MNLYVNSLQNILNKNSTLKKEIIGILYFIIEGLSKSNHLFFKISNLNLSYKLIESFLEECGPTYYDLLENTEKNSSYNSYVRFCFFEYLRDKLGKCARFEFAIFFYKDEEESFSLEILLSLKTFGFDTVPLVEMYLRWLFKSLSFLDFIYFSSFSELKFFFDTNINLKGFHILFNNSYFFDRNYKSVTPSFFYWFLKSTLNYHYKLSSVITPVFMSEKCIAYPNSLEVVNSITPLSIIHILSLYLTLNNCFLDIYTNVIYKKLFYTKSSVIYFSTLQELKNDFLYIVHFVKTYVDKTFMLEYEFYNTKFPFLPVFTNIFDTKLIEEAFVLLNKNPSLIQRVNIISSDTVEYVNGYYSLSDNTFYSFVSLTKYLPTNVLKFSNIIAYSFQDKLFIKRKFMKSDFMLFLEKRFVLFEDFLQFFSLIYPNFLYLQTVPVKIVEMNLQQQQIFLKLVTTVYSNHPFIFLNLTHDSFFDFKYSKDIPLFICINELNETLVNVLYCFVKQCSYKSYKIVLIVSPDVLNLSLLGCLFSYIFISLNTSLYNSLFEKIKENNCSLDLCITMNMFFFKKKKIKSKKNFLKDFKMQNDCDLYMEADED